MLGQGRDWRIAHYRVGDRVLVSRTGKHVTITRLVTNKYGRVSYETRGHRQYLLEDLGAVAPREGRSG